MNDLREALNLEPPFLQSLLDSHQAGIVILDLQLNISLCNPVFAHFLGYRREECYQKAWLDMVHSEDCAIVLHCIEHVFSSNSDSVKLSYRMKSILGEDFYARVNMEPIRNGLENPLGILLKVEPELPASLDQEKLFKIAEKLSRLPDDSLPDSFVRHIAEVMEVSHVHISGLDEQSGKVIPVSFWAVDGYVKDYSCSLQGSPCESVITKGQPVYIADKARELFPNDMDLVRWDIQSFIGVPLINSKSEISGLIVVMNQDVFPYPELTQFLLEVYSSRLIAELERRKSERSSREREAKCKSIFNSTSDLIYAVDPKYCLIASNEPFVNHCKTFFGHIPEIGSRVVPDHAAAEWEPLYDRALKGEEFSVEKYYQVGPASTISLLFNFTPLRSDKEEILGCTVFGRNITELKKAKDVLHGKNKQLEKFIESNLQLEHFAHLASHDLREPLRTVGNFAQLLEKRYKDRLDDDALEFIGFITTGVARMNSLVDDLLMYSRVNQGGYTTSLVNVKELIQEVVDSLGHFVDERSVRIKVRRIPEFIRGNKTQLSQLFQNLITNSIKFQDTDNTPEVIITSRSEEEMWKFSIADNGIGIRPEFQETIFGLFKKLHPSSEYSGTGIGLAICKKIVEQHGGEIWAESAPGRGTTIHFTLAR